MATFLWQDPGLPGDATAVNHGVKPILRTSAENGEFHERETANRWPVDVTGQRSCRWASSLSRAH
jgi:hypothetical protein